jgi:Na+(H+)/acetate symporter ActP
MVVDPPELTVVGFALMVTVTVGGGGAAVTITTIASRALLSATASATTVVVPVKIAVMRPLAFTVATETPFENHRTAWLTPGGPETTADAVWV